MNRRHFLAAAGTSLWTASWGGLRAEDVGYRSPSEAMNAPRETRLFVLALHGGTGVRKPDYLATIDADPSSRSYSQVTQRVPMPDLDDELHHFGWNTCSSCHGNPIAGGRRYLIVPGLRSSNIHIIDAADASHLHRIKTISGEEIRREVDLSAPHTVHCLPDGNVMISMLGNARGDGPGGFLLLNSAFEIAGRWEKSTEGMRYNYDFWYQPRHNVMVSSEWAAPNTFWGGFNPQDVAEGKYGSRLHFWNRPDRRIAHTVELGEQGLIPLEIRFFHDPSSAHGFVGAALSSTIWHFTCAGETPTAAPVITVEQERPSPQADPIPGLITDLVVSMDDRFLYFSNWLHGDIRQYDIRDPRHPKLTGQVWVGGLLGRAPKRDKQPLRGGPQMLQLSLDGKRLYVTNSLLSKWDDQFYPELAQQGSHLLQIDCDTEKGGLSINERFYVDFGAEPDGPARAHEIRYPGGDCTSDIFT